MNNKKIDILEILDTVEFTYKINNPYRLPSSMSEVGNTARPFG